MFYPVDSLKRGGRFYLCWVADSWPLRFATITHRQLWSQDIRKICDDLLKVMTNESGRPTNRFSLRLSSQLMRGLVRLYQRKVAVFLGDLCMINATVTKHVNKKWNIHEVAVDNIIRLPLDHLPAPLTIIEEEIEHMPRVEEMIKNSGNVVQNIQDITLKETSLPEIQILPPNDGFGEENPERTLQLPWPQTPEVMLGAAGGAHASAQERALDTPARALEPQRGRDARAERLSELDVTLFGKSIAADLTTGFEKDFPEIPEIQLPDLPAPLPEKQVELPVEEAVVEPRAEVGIVQVEREPVEIILEELEEAPQAKRPRLKNKLIIDKKTKLTAVYLSARIQNPSVELRCEDSVNDVIEIRVPVDTLFRRACAAGARARSVWPAPLARLFLRNLGVGARPLAAREMEEAIAEHSRKTHTRSMLERIEEEPVVIPEPQVQVAQPALEIAGEQLFEITGEQINVTELVVEANREHMDISDMPTQKILLNESQSRKRVSDYDISPKRQRGIGYASFRLSQQQALETSALMIDAEKENLPGAANIRSALGENILPMSVRRSPRLSATQPTDPEKSLGMMLMEAGLADLPPRPVHVQSNTPLPDTQKSRKCSESSETPLGSLDRTKVSLGDSDQTTDSKRFIRDQWGTEGTMIKILKFIKSGEKPLTFKRLITKGPLIAGYKAIIAARCFTSILKLKQHGFIVISKDNTTLEIKDISLGPKFD